MKRFLTIKSVGYDRITLYLVNNILISFYNNCILILKDMHTFLK